MTRTVIKTLESGQTVEDFFLLSSCQLNKQVMILLLQFQSVH
ncbi:hypothetical protein J2S74_003006 [Evansella vedderi]|uniref:Uncharacterized protein n=1 Tax=Evansella vedderi TaxID=38282 RepID=A0ABT9ZXQ0_9BACI|nr:hypothetical protein [Evansella vedderi]MDQ0255624.1 hypothetical protein [Evansella vedderi]